MADFAALEQQYGLPDGWLAAVQKQESGGNPNAVSPKGALGAFQFMPATAQQYGINPLDPDQAAQGAAQMYGDLFKKYNGDPASALAAYNWGQGNVDRQGIQNAPPETQNYIASILGKLASPSQPIMTDSPNYIALDSGSSSKQSSKSTNALASIINGIGNFIIPSANAAEVPQQRMEDMTDEQLQAIVAGKPLQSKSGIEQQDLGYIGNVPHITLRPPDQPVQMPDMEKMTDDQLQAIADGKTTPQAIHAAQQAVTAPQNSTLANATALGSDFMSGIPGMKETGSALAALAGYGGDGSYGDRYNNLEASQEAMRQAGSQTYPIGSEAAKIGGALSGLALGGGALAATLPAKAFTALAAFAKASPYTAGMVGNGAIGALQGLGDGADAASRLSNAATGGVASAAMAVPFTYGVNNIVKPIVNSVVKNGVVGTAKAGGTALQKTAASAVGAIAKATAETPKMSSMELQPLANEAYKTAETVGGNITPQGTNKILSKAESIMPQTAAGKIVRGETETTKLVNRLQTLKDKPLSLAETQEIDEAISDAIDSNTVLGKVNKEGLKLMKIQSALRDIVHNPEAGDISGSDAGFAAWKQGQKYWSQMMKMRDVERVMQKAEGSDNPQLVIKNGLKSLRDNAKKTRNWSSDEMKALNEGSTTGITQELLRAVGSRLSQYAAGGAGLAAGGPLAGAAAAAATHVASSAARKVGGGMQAAKAQKVLDVLGKNTTPKSKKP